MTEKAALLCAPLAVFPAALGCLFLSSLIREGSVQAIYMKELMVLPFLALIIAVLAYPFAVLAWPFVWRRLKRSGHTGLPATVAAAVLAAQGVFYMGIYPLSRLGDQQLSAGGINFFWFNGMPLAFRISLLAACGAACGLAFHLLAAGRPARQASG